jgi:hypothetical protein
LIFSKHSAGYARNPLIDAQMRKSVEIRMEIGAGLPLPHSKQVEVGPWRQHLRQAEEVNRTATFVNVLEMARRMMIR